MQINFVKQFKKYGITILILILLLNLILLAAWGISLAFSIPMDALTEDPASYFGYSQFIGFTTFMGMIILSAGIGAVILLISFQRRIEAKKAFWAAAGLAVISMFLILDDLFLLHERVFTGLLGVGERSIFAMYLAAFGVFLIFFRQQLIEETMVLLLISGLLFGVSLAADLLTDKVALSAAMLDSMHMLEEGSKLGGYLFWSANIILKTRDLILPEGQAKD